MKMAFNYLFAAAMDPNQMFGPRTDNAITSTASQVLMVGGAILAVGAILFLTVYFFKRGTTGDEDETVTPDSRHSSGRGLFGQRRKKRLRSRRPRNPTLAETGGLPPLRPDDRSKPSL